MVYLNILLHLDKSLSLWTAILGNWVYVLIFGVVFCETGLVVLPFLPGDSLLFVLGSLSALEGHFLSLLNLSGVILVAAFLGDNVNYYLGKKLGTKVFQSDTRKFLNRANLKRTEDFYAKYGPVAVILARFVPIIRSFAPFVAGVGRMPFLRYLAYSFCGTVLWSQIFLWLGYFFGNLPIVRKNLEIATLGIIFLSILPGLIAWWRKRSVEPSHL